MWPWKGKPEERADATDATDALIGAMLAAASGGGDVQPSGLAAIEQAAGLVGRAFAGALVSGDRLGVVSPQILEMVGRSLIRRGEIVFSLDDGPRLQPASGWEIRGMGPDSKLWTYRLNFDGPSGLTRSVYLPAGSVIHIRVNSDPSRPWAGRAPWSIASSTARTAASAEASAAAEASIPSTRIAPIPSADEAQRTAYKEALKKGGVATVQAAAQAALSGGQGQEPSARWSPAVMRPEPGDGHIRLRREAAADVLGACGIPTALFDGSEGSAKREAYRQFIFGALQPWAAIAMGELREKLSSPELLISFAGLHGADLATRGRALKQLVDAGVDLTEALAITGLSEAA